MDWVTDCCVGGSDIYPSCCLGGTGIVSVVNWKRQDFWNYFGSMGYGDTRSQLHYLVL